jgi:hypothetical protein
MEMGVEVAKVPVAIVEVAEVQSAQTTSTACAGAAMAEASSSPIRAFFMISSPTMPDGPPRFATASIRRREMKLKMALTAIAETIGSETMRGHTPV